MKRDLQNVISGSLFSLAGAQFILGLTIAEAVYPGYSVSADYISDLGATCRSTCLVMQPSAAIFDSSVFALGLLSLVGSLFVMKGHGLLLGSPFALGSLGAMGVGLLPETTGILHPIVSLIAFLFAGLAALASSRMVGAPTAFFCVILGLITLSALVLYGAGVFLGLGPGGMERLVAYPAVIWLVLFGTALTVQRTG